MATITPIPPAISTLPDALPNDVEALLPTDGFTWGGDVGAGITRSLFGNLTLDLQARDAFGKYWDKMQHDFIYSGALLLKVR